MLVRCYGIRVVWLGTALSFFFLVGADPTPTLACAHCLMHASVATPSIGLLTPHSRQLTQDHYLTNLPRRPTLTIGLLSTTSARRPRRQPCSNCHLLPPRREVPTLSRPPSLPCCDHQPKPFYTFIYLSWNRGPRARWLFFLSRGANA
jgi:hypothetical protein